MSSAIVRSPSERVLLIAISVLGLLGLNGVFLLVMLDARLRQQALADPLVWVLMIEALIVTGLLAWAFARQGIGRLQPVWFWALSLLGGLAFSVPIAFLRTEKAPRDGA
jgi:hypothetical protein